MPCSRASMLLLLVPLTPLGVLFGCDSGNTDDHTHAEDSHEEGNHEAGEGETETGGESVCEVETRDDNFAIGLEKSGALVRATFVSSDPAPPIKGDNTWVLDFTDLTGAPLSDLTIVAIPTMPDHGHGTPIDAVVTALDEAGRYQIAPVNLFMTGYWEVALDVTLAGGEQDSLMFGFCVE